MAKLPLHQGSYDARSPIASAQVAINIYPEPNPPDAPFPVTHYPGPGLKLWGDLSGASPGATGGVRGLYVTSSNAVVAVIGVAVYTLTVAQPGQAVFVGNIGGPSSQPVVSMCDNGTTLVIVDGSPNGWMVPLGALLTPNSLVQINDAAFYGANRVDFIDTFLVFNQPGTGNFYTTTSNVVTPFDPTYFAAKEGWNDRLVCCACLHDNIWLLGNQTVEIWFNAGGATFPFARMPNSILQQGCAAVCSPVVADNALYWLSQDRWGHSMIMRGEGYAARRISNFAVENEWNQYPYVTDCVGMSYQIAGHEICAWYFPAGGAWWAYDASTQMWHKRTYAGTTQPWLPLTSAFFGTVVGETPFTPVVLAGDRSSGRIYEIDRSTYTDNGTAITRQRSWTHLQQDGQRIAYQRFALSMAGNQLSPDTLALDWSDDAGLSYGSPVNQTINNQSNGQYLWRRLGYGRDRVYRATWSGAGEFALNGAYSDGTPEGT